MAKDCLQLWMARYQWLFFDADDTLFDYERSEALALARTFQRHGISFEPASLETYRRIDQEQWRALEKGLVTLDVLKVRRFELLFKAIGVTQPASAFSSVYLDYLAECSELVDGAYETLDVLRQQYRMAILTNGLKTVQRSRLAHSTIREHIADIIISEEIGFAKPAREFFEAAFTRLGCSSKQSVLMIGDNWVSDIQGASRYGLDTCWFNPRRRPRPDETPINIEITSLKELLGHLQ